MCKLKFCGLKSLPHGGANDILVSYMLKQISLVVKRNRAWNCLKGIYHLWFRDPHHISLPYCLVGDELSQS